MHTRDSNLPLVVALAIVLAGHAVAVPWFTVLLDPQRRTGSGSAPRAAVEERQRPVELGRGERVSQVAWIPYEDYRELIAPVESDTRQPAIQRDVDPVDNAPLELDPTPPAPLAEQPQPADAAPPMDDAELLMESPPPAAHLPPTTDADTPFRQPIDRAADAADDADADTSATRPADASGGEPARPTAAPRSESEATLADLTARTHDIQPGRVLTGGDLEIRTVQPRFSAVTRMSSIPRNPVAEITFNPDGSVRDVQFSRTTGYANVDRPLRSSLYQWRAAGDGLERIDEPFTITMRILLMPE